MSEDANTNMIVMMEGLYRDAEVAAMRHFDGLIACAKAAFPEFLWTQLPKREEISGMFSASSKLMYLFIFRDIPGYSPMMANFKFADNVWRFENFTLELGMFGHVYNANNLPDAVYMSRNYEKLKPQAGVNEAKPASTAVM